MILSVISAVSANNITDSTDEPTFKDNLTTTNHQMDNSKEIKSSSQSKNKSKIVVANKTTYYKDKAQLVATVVDKQANTYAQSGKVLFKVNSISIATVNVKNGKAVYVYDTSNLSTKKYNITAVFSGNGQLESSRSQSSTLKIIKYNTKIASKSITSTYGNVVNISSTVVDSTHDVYAREGYVLYKINGLTIKKVNVVNGKSSVLYDTSNLTAKKYTLSMIYSGSNSLMQNSCNTTLTIQKATPTIALNNINTEANTVTSIKATLKSAKAINEGIVTFKLNGVVIGKVNVKNSAATLQYSFKNMVKNYTIQAIYSGTNRYNSVSSNAKAAVTLKVYSVNWNSKGNIKSNTVLYSNLPKSTITDKFVNIAKTATPYTILGNGNGKTIFIVAGIHGNELSSQVAAMKLINDLSTKEINGTLYIFPFVAPSYTGNNTRALNGVNLNSVADKAGTLSNNLYKFAKSHNATVLGDFHCTQPGGVPGKDTAMATYSPMYSSSQLANYISSDAGVSKIIYAQAGQEYPGAVEDYCNANGITSVTCEVMTPHGSIASGSVSTSYAMMKSLLKYYKAIVG